MKPLTKWIGGKSRLASQIANRIPMVMSEYHEPFVGGGALFCELMSGSDLDEVSRVSLGDTNPDLMNLYTAVQNKREMERFSASAWGYAQKYNEGDETVRERMYYESRDFWNQGHRDSGRFVFLKQTAFNGLWRVNKAGELNASWGKYKTVAMPSEGNIRLWHAALQHIELRTGPYTELVVAAGACVYVDPPYYGAFDGYTAAGFNHADHVELLCNVWKWRNAGATVIYSNSFDEHLVKLLAFLWPDAEIDGLKTKYVVNTDGAGRTEVREMLAVG